MKSATVESSLSNTSNYFLACATELSENAFERDVATARGNHGC